MHSQFDLWFEDDYVDSFYLIDFQLLAIQVLLGFGFYCFQRNCGFGGGQMIGVVAHFDHLILLIEYICGGFYFVLEEQPIFCVEDFC